MSKEILVPTALSGVITKHEDLSCMDGASYLIHTITGATRLKGKNATVTKHLDIASDKQTQEMVMGYPAWEAECLYVSVYYVSPIADVNKAIQDGRPWPW